MLGAGSRRLLATCAAVLLLCVDARAAAGARVHALLSQESLHLARTQAPCLFTTVVLSAPREQGLPAC